MKIIKRFHGTRCIISNMNNGRDMSSINQLIIESNRQKLETRITNLEYTVKQLCEKMKKKDDDLHQSISTGRDCKHVN